MGCSSTKSADTSGPSKTIDLNKPYKLGDLELKNRFVMGPMTRCRGDPATGIPNDLMAQYYEQRSHFGLILTECSQISPISNAFPGSGGIYNDEQTEGWRKVVDRVHAKGGKIVLQIWHCGRAVPKEFIGGEDPLAPSAIAISTPHGYTKQPHPVPKEMTQDDINDVVEQFRKGAENAKKAGFDGVQLHAANGYLVHQFLSDGSNQRTDSYGGSIENRSKFLFECLDALISVYGSQRVSVRFSPTGRYNDMYDSNPLEQMKYVLNKLNSKNLHFVEIKRHNMMTDKADPSESNPDQDSQGRTLPEKQISGDTFFSTLRKLYNGTLISNDGQKPDQVAKDIQQGHLDLASYSSLAINNPDLPQRVQNGQEFNNNMDFGTFFAGGEKGYTDIPEYKEWKSQQGEQ